MRVTAKVEWGKGPLRGKVEAAYVDSSFKTFERGLRKMVVV